MKILFLGSGYVGLVSGTCFAELGFSVTTADIDKNKIESLKKGIIPIYEPSLQELVIKNTNNSNLSFSSDIENEIKKADVIFIAVGTPSKPDGSANLDYVFNAAELIAKNAKNGVLIVTKSTVPVATGEKLKNLITNANSNLQFNIASNPEFLREGSAVSDFMNPDRIVIGVENELAKNILEKLYKKFIDKNIPFVATDIKSAELAKYAANSYIAMRIGFVNELADICDNAKANIDDVTKIMGLDFRIGSHYLKCGPGFGGSCFPKDTKAFCNIAENFSSPSQIISAVVKSNENHKLKMVEKILQAANYNVKGKNIAILGVAFKSNTDDIRDSASLVIIEELQKKGANLNIYDPEALENAKKYFTNKQGLNFCENLNDATKNADLVVIATEWGEFKTLTLNIKTIILDLRNINNNTENQIIRLGK
jgi:UDPglucose 6-dehydrogenase